MFLGNHQKLLRLGGLYAKLVRRQLMSTTQKQDTGDDEQPSRDCQLSEAEDVSDESDGGESLSSGSMPL